MATQTKQAARLGPRPLPLHLMTAALTFASSNAALPLLRSGSLGWSPSGCETGPAGAAALASDLARADGRALGAAVEREGRRRLGLFLDGVQTYRNHPYRRDLADPPSCWSDGSTRLLHFPPDEPGQGDGRPLLVVPSLINRSYVLDLSSRGSFMRWLAARGFDGYLVDWGPPGAVERGFDLTDYIAGRLDAAFSEVRERSGRPLAVVGYCMGGDLALALALRRQAEISGLALLATPWDFHAERPDQAVAVGAAGQALEPQLALFGELSTDVIQGLFCSLDPLLALRKFIGFAALDPGSERALDFVALEDWLNDGVPLSAPVARECLCGWYGANQTARLGWRVAGETVDPGRFRKPSLVMIPAQDRIVPPLSASALAAALPDCRVARPAAGHIGMMTGGRAAERVWMPLADWLSGLGD